VRGEIDRETD